MQKDFGAWHKLKAELEKENRELFAHPREIWWCSLGVNLGAEIDGKNENFERPVLVMRVYNKETMLILPITSKEKADGFHYKIEVSAKNPKTKETFFKPAWIKLTQARVISNKRLFRKVDNVSEEEFSKIKERMKSFFG